MASVAPLNHYPEADQSVSSFLPVKALSFDEKVTELGRRILSGVRVERASLLSKQFWSQRFMEWSTTTPSLKRNLFRLVDVLPSLESSEAIADHVWQYLGEDAEEVPRIVGWGIRSKKGASAALLAFAVKMGVRQMAGQFIAGETPHQALPVLRKLRRSGLAFTVDLLGEYCVSEREADIYYKRYLECFTILGKRVASWRESAPLVDNNPGERTATCVSVKLSALYSQVGSLNENRSVSILSDRLASLAAEAKRVNAQLYVDAEDSATNELIFKAFKRVYGSSEFRTEPMVGCVVQAYARDSMDRLRDLKAFAESRGASVAVRLVKGAYWDQETTIARQNDWASPLFAHKQSSDSNYEKLSRYLLDNHELLFPAFGSHNIRSLSHACIYAEAKGLTNAHYELQMLYGMADPIARSFRAEDRLVRMYVPLGPLLPGMGYLVRRLLENTSNESFLRHTFFEEHEMNALLAAPCLHPEDA